MNANARDHYVAEFARVEAALPGQRLPWLRRVREKALERFADIGQPTQRQEDWKYTSVAALEKTPFAVLPQSLNGIAAGQVEALRLPGTHLLVFVNGRHQPGLSRLGPLPGGVRVGSLAQALEDDPQRLQAWLSRQADGSGFAALNAAFMADGAWIELAPGAALDEPIHLLFIAAEAGLAMQPRNIVFAQERSRVAIVEHYVAAERVRYLTNAVTEIVAGRGARVEHHRLQQESLDAFHIGAVRAEQQHASRYGSGAFALGAGLSRVDIEVALDAEEAQCTLDGLYLSGGRQHVDHHTRIDHNRPRGTSRELYKGVLEGKSRAVFNGKVIVHPQAQGTDAHQSNRNLLLSLDAEVDTKPQLEIYADDVKCSHGATVGQLDAGQIHYLRSRGIDEQAARALLTFAFCAEVAGRVGIAALRERLQHLLRVRLGAQGEELP